MNIGPLNAAIKAVCSDFVGCSSSGQLWWHDTATQADRDAGAAIAADWDFSAGCWLRDTPRAYAAASAAAIAAIDARSAVLIGEGLQADDGSPISLSAAAQQNLTNIGVALMMQALALPQDISRLDGRAYTIRDAADAKRIALLAGQRIKAVLDAGRELRSRVLAATTQDEIEAVTDERT